MFLLASRAAHAAIPSSERQALLDLYTSTNGAGWSVSTGWNDAAGTECGWFGVTCDGPQTTVTGISLEFNNMVGPLPATIGNLPNLSFLYLGGNELSGSIPSFAANTALSALSLGDNQLSGSIPSFAANTALSSLLLVDNQLSGSIPSFATNTALRLLYLHFNQLSGSIPSFGTNTALEELVLNNNQLSGSIPSFATNTALENLALHNNQLSGSVPPFASNAALQYLDLSFNQLSGSIPSFATNTALLWLYLHFNQLSGSIPSFATNTALQRLWLHSNQLSGPIPSFATNTALETLYLRSNRLIGSVHPSLGALTNLEAANGLELRWNAIFSTDAMLIAFLNSKQVGGDWQSTQTIPVTGLSVSGALPAQVTVNWTPIIYTGDAGNYQVFYSTASGGPYTASATVTADKSAASLTVIGLTPLTPYFFVVQTTTEPHASNQNTVLSGYSVEVAGATTPVELMRFEIE